jgi:shikimate kinase
MGYMGSGKSTVGKLLAEKLKMNFIDFDEYVEKEVGKSIIEIFETDGEKKFRMLEEHCLKKILDKDNIVISLGGGTPCYHNNIELINKNGISVYIKMSVDELVKRLLKVRNNRPLIRDLSKQELSLFVKTHLEKRSPIYQKAHHIVSAEKLNAEQVAEIIEKRIDTKNTK